MKRILMTAILTLASAASSQQLNVATGSSTGTYSQMFSNLGKVCSNSSWLLERKTSGSIENINLLLGNQVSLAFVQLDVLKAKEQLDGDPRVKDIKTLIPLSSEEVHILTRASNSYNSYESLKPYKANAFSRTMSVRKVGAWGGSVVTARVLSAMTGIKYEVVSFNNKEDALASLRLGKIDAIIAVVGQPASWVSEATGIKLIPIQNITKLTGVYSAAKVFYPQLSMSGVNTVSVQSLLVTRDYKTGEKKKQLLDYQACASKNLVKLSETEGFHPKWSEVNLSVYKWPRYGK